MNNYTVTSNNCSSISYSSDYNNDCGIRINGMNLNDVINNTYNNIYNVEHELESKIVDMKVSQDGLTCYINTIDNRLKEIEHQHELEKYEKEMRNDKMIEANQIVRLYVKNREEEIKKERDKKIKEHRESNVFVSQYNAIVNDAINKLKELYLQQFPEGTLENDVNKETLVIVRSGNQDVCFDTNYEINEYYTDNKLKEIDEEGYAKLDALHKLAQEVETMLGICETREEVMEVLQNYDIVDKKGKLK